MRQVLCHAHVVLIVCREEAFGRWRRRRCRALRVDGAGRVRAERLTLFGQRQLGRAVVSGAGPLVKQDVSRGVVVFGVAWDLVEKKKMKNIELSNTQAIVQCTFHGIFKRYHTLG